MGDRCPGACQVAGSDSGYLIAKMRMTGSRNRMVYCQDTYSSCDWSNEECCAGDYYDDDLKMKTDPLHQSHCNWVCFVMVGGNYSATAAGNGHQSHL